MSEVPAGLEEFVSQPQAGASGDIPPGLAEFVAPELKEEQFGTPAQQAMAFLEGAGKGATFGLSTKLQTALGASPKNIRAREEVNPVTAGAGELTGLVASSFVPGGEGAILEKAGSAVAGKLIPKAVTPLEKVGSAAARGIVENAMVSAGDELSKSFAQHPEQTVENAIAHIGLGAAIGGVAGGVIGSVSPLWDATLGPKAKEFLNMIKDKAEGKILSKSSELDTVIGSLEKHGVDVSPEIKAGLSEHPEANAYFQSLRESGNSHGEALRQTIDKFKSDVADNMVKAVKPTEELSAYEAGQKAKDLFSNQLEALKEEGDKAFEPINAQYKNLSLLDENKNAAKSALKEQGSEFGAPGNAERQMFDRYSKRIDVIDNLDHLKKLITEVNGEIQKVKPTFASQGNPNEFKALLQIRDSLKKFENNSIESAFRKFSPDAEALIAQRKAANAKHIELLNTLSEIAGAAKTGGAHSEAGLQAALEKIPPEKLASNLFDKKNYDKLLMLKEKYPQIYQALENQFKTDLLNKATGAGDVLSHTKLFNQINGLTKEVKNLIFTPEQLKLIDSSSAVLRKTGERIGQSGTPRTLDQLWQHLPAGVGAMVGLISGHNPMVGMALGAAGRYLAREAPDTVKLSLLKFLGSPNPVDAGAWKAAADFIHSTQKGQNLIQKSVKNVFAAGRDVLPKAIIPSEKETKKLDERISEFGLDPSKMMNIGGKTAHYLPEQASGLAKTTSVAVQYLNSIKPREPVGTVFDTKKEIPKADEAAYHRQLQIADQPLMILEHIKSGELIAQDVATVKTIYPNLHTQLTQMMVNEAIENKGEQIPYQTRLSMAMFMGQPLDGTMQPQNIMAAQGVNAVSQAQAQGMNQPPRQHGSMAKLGKSNLAYQTPGQAREATRQGKA